MVKTKIKQYTMYIHFAIKRGCEHFIKKMINNENIDLLFKNYNVDIIKSYENWYKRNKTSYLILYLVLQTDINRLAYDNLGCWYRIRRLINYKNIVKSTLKNKSKCYINHRIFHWRKIIRLVELKCYHNDITY